MEPIFRLDFNSPYAYLAAARIGEVLPGARWQPIAFAFLLRGQGRTPWSFDEAERPQGIDECERRAAAYGLPPLTWPEGWPAGSYTLDPLRAALAAEEHGLLREYAMAAFARNFVTGTGLLGDAALEVAEEVGLDRAAIAAAVEGDAKERLRAVTDEAIAAGVPGVPTVTVGNEHFWGDDRLEDAAAAAVRAE